jgi:hypothetical protein
MLMEFGWGGLGLDNAKYVVDFGIDGLTILDLLLEVVILEEDRGRGPGK